MAKGRNRRRLELPKSDAEMLVLVEQAEAWLLFDAAEKYGLITGGPTVDVARCEEIIAEGKERELEATQAGINAAVGRIVREHCR